MEMTRARARTDAMNTADGRHTEPISRGTLCQSQPTDMQLNVEGWHSESGSTVQPSGFSSVSNLPCNSRTTAAHMTSEAPRATSVGLEVVLQSTFPKHGADRPPFVDPVVRSKTRKFVGRRSGGGN
jgi:hypothetical protein